MQSQKLQITIGKKIKELRLHKGWTQEQASEKLYICRNTYSDIELGKTDICLSRLVQLANFYNVDVSYFVNENGQIVLYLNGTQNYHDTSQIKNQCNEYLSDFAEEKLKLELKDKELTMQRHEIENLREIITLLKNQLL